MPNLLRKSAQWHFCWKGLYTTSVMSSYSVFPPSKKKERGGGGGGRYNFSMRSKQIKHSNDHIKGNQVRKGGGGRGAPWYTRLVLAHHKARRTLPRAKGDGRGVRGRERNFTRSTNLLLPRCENRRYFISLFLQEAAQFKLSGLQHQLSENIPSSLLERANREHDQLVAKYQQLLQRQTSHTADARALEQLQVSLKPKPHSRSPVQGGNWERGYVHVGWSRTTCS